MIAGVPLGGDLEDLAPVRLLFEGVVRIISQADCILEDTFERSSLSLGISFELCQGTSDECHTRLPVLFAPTPLADNPFVQALSGVSGPRPEGGCVATGVGEVTFQEATAEIGGHVFTR